MSFKLIVKDGETKYSMNKRGVYSSKIVDRVEEFDTLGEALAEFLYNVNDEYTDEKVSLVFNPSKKGKK